MQNFQRQKRETTSYNGEVTTNQQKIGDDFNSEKKKRITIKESKKQNKNKTAKSAQFFIGKKYSIVTTNLTAKKNRRGQKTSLWS